MSIELQFRGPILGGVIGRAVRAQLRTACFMPFAIFYLDHADVVDPIEFRGTNGSVRFHVPIDVFVVTRADVLATPNAIPVGAVDPAGRVLLVMELSTAGTIVRLQCIDAVIDALAGPLGSSLPLVKAVIMNAVGSPARTDLAEVLSTLGMTSSGSSSRIDVIGDIIAIRFEPIDRPVDHLTPGQEWGVFVDENAVQRLAESKSATAGLSKQVTSLKFGSHWRPAGSIPHVDVDYTGKPALPEPFTATVDGTLSCEFSLAPAPFRILRTAVHWSLHLHAKNVPAFVEDDVEDFLAAVISHRLDKTPGVATTGNHDFIVETTLPEVAFGGSRLDYASAVAMPGGMTIGGSVITPGEIPTSTVQPSVQPFGRPYHLDLCSQRARTGSGEPKTTVPLGEVTTTAHVGLEGSGKICDYEVIAPGGWIKPYIRLMADIPDIKIVIPSAVALAITEPVRILVRTGRGVRLIDFGTPPAAQVDSSGNVTNALIDFIPDCPDLPFGSRNPHGLTWGREHGARPGMPPAEHPDWTTYLGRQRGIEVQLIKLSGLEPGELIQFRSDDHAADVTADPHGRALVPVLMPLSNDLPVAHLLRVNRQDIAGHFAVRTKAFVARATLPAGTCHRWVSAVDGTSRLMIERAGRTQVHEFGPLGGPALVTREETTLNPQPLPPHADVKPDPADAWSQRINLPGLVTVLPVPGFASAPIALAP